MTINLNDIRQACYNYLSTSVICKIENLVADVPNAISPGEGFKFDLRVTNNGNIRITKVKYHLFVTDPSKAKLIVPASPFGVHIARAGYTDDSAVLWPGSQVSEMYLFPRDIDRMSLEPAETDLWTNIRGIANSLGSTSIRFNVLGQVDVEYLFPLDAHSNPAINTIQVV
jgi:hypothetical protein